MPSPTVGLGSIWVMFKAFKKASIDVEMSLTANAALASFPSFKLSMNVNTKK
jgi:hypothetical protein